MADNWKNGILPEAGSLDLGSLAYDENDSLEDIAGKYNNLGGQINNLTKAAANDVSMRQTKLIGNDFGGVNPWMYASYYQPAITGALSDVRIAGADKALSEGMERGKAAAEANLANAKNNYSSAMDGYNNAKEAFANLTIAQTPSGLLPDGVTESEAMTIGDFMDMSKEEAVNKYMHSYTDAQNVDWSNQKIWSDAVNQTIRDKGVNTSNWGQSDWDNFWADKNVGKTFEYNYVSQAIREEFGEEKYNNFVSSYNNVVSAIEGLSDWAKGITDNLPNVDFDLFILGSESTPELFQGDWFQKSLSGVFENGGSQESAIGFSANKYSEEEWIDENIDERYRDEVKEKASALNKLLNDKSYLNKSNVHKRAMDIRTNNPLAYQIETSARNQLIKEHQQEVFEARKEYLLSLEGKLKSTKETDDLTAINADSFLKNVMGMTTRDLTLLRSWKLNNPDEFESYKNQLAMAYGKMESIEVADGKRWYYTKDGYVQLKAGTPVFFAPDGALNDDGSIKSPNLKHFMEVWKDYYSADVDKISAEELTNKQTALNDAYVEYMKEVSLNALVNTYFDVPITPDVYNAVLACANNPAESDYQLSDGTKISDFIKDFNKKGNEEKLHEFYNYINGAYSRTGKAVLFSQYSKQLSTTDLEYEEDSYARKLGRVKKFQSVFDATPLKDASPEELSDYVAKFLVLTRSMEKYNSGAKDGNIDPGFMAENIVPKFMKSLTSQFAGLANLATGLLHFIISPIPALFGATNPWEFGGTASLKNVIGPLFGGEKEYSLNNPWDSAQMAFATDEKARELAKNTINPLLVDVVLGDKQISEIRGVADYASTQNRTMFSSPYAFYNSMNTLAAMMACNYLVEAPAFNLAKDVAGKVATRMSLKTLPITQNLKMNINTRINRYSMDPYEFLDNLDDPLQVDNMVKHTQMLNADDATELSVAANNKIAEANPIYDADGNVVGYRGLSSLGDNSAINVLSNAAKTASPDDPFGLLNYRAAHNLSAINPVDLDDLYDIYGDTAKTFDSAMSSYADSLLNTANAIGDMADAAKSAANYYNASKAFTGVTLSNGKTISFNEASAMVTANRAVGVYTLSQATGLDPMTIVQIPDSQRSFLIETLHSMTDTSSGAIINGTMRDFLRTLGPDDFKDLVGSFSEQAQLNAVLGKNWDVYDTYRALGTAGWQKSGMAALKHEFMVDALTDPLRDFKRNVLNPQLDDEGNMHIESIHEYLSNPNNFIQNLVWSSFHFGLGRVTNQVKSWGSHVLSEKYTTRALNAIEATGGQKLDETQKILQKATYWQAKAQSYANKAWTKGMKYDKVVEYSSNALAALDKEFEMTFGRNGWDINYGGIPKHLETVEEVFDYLDHSKMPAKDGYMQIINMMQLRAAILYHNYSTGIGTGVRELGSLTKEQYVKLLDIERNTLNKYHDQFTDGDKDKNILSSVHEMYDLYKSEVLAANRRGEFGPQIRNLEKSLDVYYGRLEQIAAEGLKEGIIPTLRLGFIPIGSMTYEGSFDDMIASHHDASLRGLSDSGAIIDLTVADPSLPRKLITLDMLADAFKRGDQKLEIKDEKGELLKTLTLDYDGLNPIDNLTSYSNSYNMTKYMNPLFGHGRNFFGIAMKNGNAYIVADLDAMDVAYKKQKNIYAEKIYGKTDEETGKHTAGWAETIADEYHKTGKISKAQAEKLAKDLVVNTSVGAKSAKKLEKISKDIADLNNIIAKNENILALGDLPQSVYPTVGAVFYNDGTNVDLAAEGKRLWRNGIQLSKRMIKLYTDGEIGENDTSVAIKGVRKGKTVYKDIQITNDLRTMLKNAAENSGQLNSNLISYMMVLNDLTTPYTSKTTKNGVTTAKFVKGYVSKLREKYNPEVKKETPTYTYEVSTAGDKAWSPLVAKFKPGTMVRGLNVGGMTIEDAYQKVFKKSGKGQPPAADSIINEGINQPVVSASKAEVVVAPGGSKAAQSYADEIGGVNVLRQSGTNEHYGNPFSIKKYTGVKKIVGSIDEAVRDYESWLRGTDFQDIEPERRQWILNQINSGALDGKKLVYYTNDVDGGDYFNARGKRRQEFEDYERNLSDLDQKIDESGGAWDQLEEELKEMKTVAEYNAETAPNHAHILQKLVNEHEAKTPSATPAKRVETVSGKITPEVTKANPDKVYLFGDNIEDAKSGYVPKSTQAVIRGQENAIGIPTKKNRGTYDSSYFTDADFDEFKKGVDKAISDAKKTGKTIVIPADGIGTGKAQLQTRAPKCFKYLTDQLDNLATGTSSDTRVSGSFTKNESLPLKKIISGGQTGIDTIGLQIGKQLGYETGGTAAPGFATEAGKSVKALKGFGLAEISKELQGKSKGKSFYLPRTEQNVINSDGTVYFKTDADSAGYIATRNFALANNKPFIENPKPDKLRDWIIENNIQTLNVAGNRGTASADINAKTRDTLLNALSNEGGSDTYSAEMRSRNKALLPLYDEYMNQNPEATQTLATNAKGKRLTDKFAKTAANQASVIDELLIKRGLRAAGEGVRSNDSANSAIVAKVTGRADGKIAFGDEEFDAVSLYSSHYNMGRNETGDEVIVKTSEKKMTTLKNAIGKQVSSFKSNNNGFNERYSKSVVNRTMVEMNDVKGGFDGGDAIKKADAIAGDKELLESYAKTFYKNEYTAKNGKKRTASWDLAKFTKTLETAHVIDEFKAWLDNIAIAARTDAYDGILSADGEYTVKDVADLAAAVSNLFDKAADYSNKPKAMSEINETMDEDGNYLSDDLRYAQVDIEGKPLDDLISGRRVELSKEIISEELEAYKTVAEAFLDKDHPLHKIFEGKDISDMLKERNDARDIVRKYAKDLNDKAEKLYAEGKGANKEFNNAVDSARGKSEARRAEFAEDASKYIYLEAINVAPPDTGLNPIQNNERYSAARLEQTTGVPDTTATGWSPEITDARVEAGTVGGHLRQILRGYETLARLYGDETKFARERNAIKKIVGDPENKVPGTLPGRLDKLSLDSQDNFENSLTAMFGDIYDEGAMVGMTNKSQYEFAERQATIAVNRIGRKTFNLGDQSSKLSRAEAEADVETARNYLKIFEQAIPIVVEHDAALKDYERLNSETDKYRVRIINYRAELERQKQRLSDPRYDVAETKAKIDEISKGIKSAENYLKNYESSSSAAKEKYLSTLEESNKVYEAEMHDLWNKFGEGSEYNWFVSNLEKNVENMRRVTEQYQEATKTEPGSTETWGAFPPDSAIQGKTSLFTVPQLRLTTGLDSLPKLRGGNDIVNLNLGTEEEPNMTPIRVNVEYGTGNEDSNTGVAVTWFKNDLEQLDPNDLPEDVRADLFKQTAELFNEEGRRVSIIKASDYYEGAGKKLNKFGEELEGKAILDDTGKPIRVDEQEWREKARARLEEIKEIKEIYKEQEKEARSLGDLKENEDYRAAREALAALEREEAELKGELSGTVSGYEGNVLQELSDGYYVVEAYDELDAEEREYTKADFEKPLSDEEILERAVADFAERTKDYNPQKTINDAKKELEKAKKRQEEANNKAKREKRTINKEQITLDSAAKEVLDETTYASFKKDYDNWKETSSKKPKDRMYRSSDGTVFIVDKDEPIKTGYVRISDLLETLGMNPKTFNHDVSEARVYTEEEIAADLKDRREMMRQINKNLRKGNVKYKNVEEFKTPTKLDLKSRTMTINNLIALGKQMKKTAGLKELNYGDVVVSKDYADMLFRYSREGIGPKSFGQKLYHGMMISNEWHQFIQQTQLAGGVAYSNALSIAAMRGAIFSSPAKMALYLKTVSDFRNNDALKVFAIENEQRLASIAMKCNAPDLLTDLMQVCGQKPGLEGAGAIASALEKTRQSFKNRGVERTGEEKYNFIADAIKAPIDALWGESTFTRVLPVMRAKMAIMYYDDALELINKKFPGINPDDAADAASKFAFAREEAFFNPERTTSGMFKSRRIDEVLQDIADHRLRDVLSSLTGAKDEPSLGQIAKNCFFALGYKNRMIQPLAQGTRSLVSPAEWGQRFKLWGKTFAVTDDMSISGNNTMNMLGTQFMQRGNRNMIGSLALIAAIAFINAKALGLATSWDDLSFIDENDVDENGNPTYKVPEILKKFQTIGQIWIPNARDENGRLTVDPTKRVFGIDTMSSVFTLPNTFWKTVDRTINPNDYYSAPQRGVGLLGQEVINPQGLNNVLNAPFLRAIGDELIGSNLISPYKAMYEVLVDSSYYGNNIWEKKYLADGTKNKNYDPMRNIKASFFHILGLDDILDPDGYNRWVKGYYTGKYTAQDQVGTITGSGILQHEYLTMVKSFLNGKALEGIIEGGELPIKSRALSSAARTEFNTKVKNIIAQYMAEYRDVVDNTTDADKIDEAYAKAVKQSADAVAAWSKRHNYALGKDQKLVPFATRTMMVMLAGEYDDNLDYVQNTYWKASEIAQIEASGPAEYWLDDADLDYWVKSGKTPEEFAKEKDKRTAAYYEALDNEYKARKALHDAGIDNEYLAGMSYENLRAEQRQINKEVYTGAMKAMESPIGEFDSFKEMKSYFEAQIDAATTTKAKAKLANQYNKYVTDKLAPYVEKYGAAIISDSRYNNKYLANALADYIIIPADKYYSGKTPRASYLKDLFHVGYKDKSALPSDEEVIEGYAQARKQMVAGASASSAAILDSIIQAIKKGTLYASDSDYSKIVKMKALLSARSK